MDHYGCTESWSMERGHQGSVRVPHGLGVPGPVATGGSPRGQSRTSQPGPFLLPQREAGHLGGPSLEAQGRAVGSRGPALLQYYWGRD